MKAINIEWDTSGDDFADPPELPDEIEIPDGMTDPEEISDYITDRTGFCHFGFSLDPEPKIYTFEIDFDNIETGSQDQIQFCAYSESEALKLFNEWCIDDMKMNSPPEPAGISVVFDSDDKDEYGDSYGTPEEYYSAKG